MKIAQQDFEQENYQRTYFDKNKDSNPSESYFNFPSFLITFKELLIKSIPRVLCYELNLITMSLINIYLLGQKGNLHEIAAFGLGDAYGRIFGYSVIKHLNITLQNNCNIAYSAKNYELVGIFYQRGLLFTGFLCVILAPLLCFSSHILGYINIEQQLAYDAGNYVWVCLGSFFASSYYDTTNNYLQSQNVVYPQIGLQLAQSFIHYFLADNLINKRDMGVLGAAWAKNMSDFILSMCLYFFITFKSPTPKTWIEWDKTAFDNVIRNLQRALKNGATSYLEETALLILTFISVYTDQRAITVTHISLNNSALGHISFFLGFQYIIQNYIGNSIRRGHINKAKRRAFHAFISIFILIVILLICLQQNAKSWSAFLNSNTEIQMNMVRSLFIYQKVLLCDGIQITLCSFIKALNKATIISYIYLFCYFVGTTISYSSWENSKEMGIWSGWIISNLMASIAFLVVIKTTDWEKQHKQIKFKMLQDKIFVEVVKK
ncbi:hypothetical protein IMG5_007780 [Ichthyophthirius multifiliis]|uniref:Uncharacterized protein n=1 Tax=Ichthyophthirius multifiliis TaxID=5932 RepID=G0QJQ9_ICHMU|nr:hypothetical protein IMG5_007780 [Ichthyophthirius multifiliis]EGR34541.1 hypothetical protein IMG5_007780 [Ichthyophthirius multifiliis]|eukprot:XP_004039845.1 hypothetical protein IMG5_007780 [Ichthyophthirius multifiliis]